MTYPFGIDVSSYQKNMDWSKAMATGARFAFVKATEGNRVDPYFSLNWRELHKLKLPCGAYHFFRPRENLIQIHNFVQEVINQGDGQLVLDLEDTGGLNRNAMTDLVNEALELIWLAVDHYPIIYSRASWLNSYINVGELPKLDYWLAQYKFANPFPFFTDMYPTDKLTAPRGIERQQIKFHQGSEKGNGSKYGAQSYYIDTNRFIGTQEELVAYFGGVVSPVVSEPEPVNAPLYQARVIADVLNVRSSPEIADNVVTQYRYGKVVDVFEEVVE